MTNNEIKVWNEAVTACQKRLLDGWLLIDGISVTFGIGNPGLFLAQKALGELKKESVSP